MELLYALEQIRVPVLNEFMLLITQLGEETAFLVAAMTVFWCVDKKKGYYMMTVGFIGTMLNQFLKLACRVPRPWILDPEFTILEQAREAATGFSFPSGHSTSSVGTFGAISAFSKKRWIKGICIAICVLVPFSRMYIGVHTLADVVIGTLLALVLVILFYPMSKGVSERAMGNCMSIMLVLAAGLLLFVRFYPFDIHEFQFENLESGYKNAYTMLGAICGLMVVYPTEKNYVQFETKAVWWAQILKLLLGFVLVLLVKEGLRSPLEALFAGHMAARAVRYFLIVLVAGLLWPMSFRWFSKLGVKQ